MAEYLNYGGWMSLPPLPHLCNDSLIYCFAFPANLAACQDYLDRSYNRLAGYQQFRVMLDRVGVFAVNAREIRLAKPPFSLEGSVAECDIGFWLLVGSYQPHATQPSMIAWIPTYLFVNNALMIAGGREVLGYPKYYATIDWPDINPSEGPFGASGLAIATYGIHARATQQRLLSLTANNLVPAPLTDSDSASQVFRTLCTGADEKMLDQIAGRLDQPSFLGTVDGLPFPLFYLKQIRAGDSTTAACVQQLLQGPLVVTKLRCAKLLHGEWRLEVGVYDSMPFVRDLGLGTPVNGRLTLTTPIGLFADVDFNVGLAQKMT